MLDKRNIKPVTIITIIETRHELVISLDSFTEMNNLTHLINSSEIELTTLPPLQLVVPTRDESVSQDRVYNAIENALKILGTEEHFKQCVMIAGMGTRRAWSQWVVQVLNEMTADVRVLNTERDSPCWPRTGSSQRWYLSLYAGTSCFASAMCA